MSRVRRTGTAPELALRSAMHARGLRFRVQVAVPTAPRRTIDIALTRAKVAIFVDGCFWHGCPQHLHLPAHNREWWRWKLHSVQTRDADTDARLRDSGWLVVRVWEHEDPGATSTRLETIWRARVTNARAWAAEAAMRPDGERARHRAVSGPLPCAGRPASGQLQPEVLPQPSQT